MMRMARGGAHGCGHRLSGSSLVGRSDLGCILRMRRIIERCLGLGDSRGLGLGLQWNSTLCTAAGGVPVHVHKNTPTEEREGAGGAGEGRQHCRPMHTCRPTQRNKQYSSTQAGLL
jgi:hypothetical protein